MDTSFHSWNTVDLAALVDFNLVANHGGIGRASRAAGRPKATLSRRVRDLEVQLGVRLVDRGAHALRLTEEGRALHERTAALLAELTEAGEALSWQAPTPRGRLRVSAPVVFAQVALATFGARFARAYPEVELEIVAEDRVADLVDDGYDVVIRIDPASDDRLVGRRLMSDQRLVVAAPGMPIPGTGRAAPIAATEAMSVAAVVLNTWPARSIWHTRTDEGETLLLAPLPVLRVSSLLMAREAVLAGGGAALLPRLLVAEDVAAGRLVRWGTQAGPPVEIWALQNSRRLTSAKVRAFLDSLVKVFSP